MKGYITYYVHDSSVYLVPHYALPAELPSIINECRKVAVADMKEAGAAHAVYGVKKYESEAGGCRGLICICRPSFWMMTSFIYAQMRKLKHTLDV